MKTYTVQVVGRLWNHSLAAYDYKADTYPATAWHVKQLAGDFNTVEDYQVLEVTREYRQEGAKSITTITEELVRSFALDDSEDKYAEIMSAA